MVFCRIFIPMKHLLYILSFFLFGLICQAEVGEQMDSTGISNKIWDELLQKHVGDMGDVNYKGFVQAKDSLEDYLNILSSNPVNDSWSREAALAYWINAYNAFTVKLIVDNYPVESIRDLNPTFYIPMVRTVWHRKFFKIGGKEMNLDTIEHEILRKKFNEPRIHFAIVCASKSCPVLLNESFEEDKIYEQLDRQTKAFLADKSRNIIREDEVEISKIFSWFSGDFTKDGSLIDFLNLYSPIEISEDASIRYVDYDWSLNE